MVSISMVLVTYHQPQSENIRRKLSKISHKFYIVCCSEQCDEISHHLTLLHPGIPQPSTVSWLYDPGSEILDPPPDGNNSLTLHHNAYILRLTSRHHRHSIISHHHKKGEYSTIRYSETEVK